MKEGRGSGLVIKYMGGGSGKVYGVRVIKGKEMNGVPERGEYSAWWKGIRRDVLVDIAVERWKSNER